MEKADQKKETTKIKEHISNVMKGWLTNIDMKDYQHDANMDDEERARTLNLIEIIDKITSTWD